MSNDYEVQYTEDELEKLEQLPTNVDVDAERLSEVLSEMLNGYLTEDDAEYELGGKVKAVPFSRAGYFGEGLELRLADGRLFTLTINLKSY